MGGGATPNLRRGRGEGGLAHDEKKWTEQDLRFSKGLNKIEWSITRDQIGSENVKAGFSRVEVPHHL